MKEIILQTLIFMGWLAYASIEGIREAHYYRISSYVKNLTTPNLHPLFFMQRFFVATVCYVPLNNILLLIPMALCFSFIHNGSYFCKRNDLDDFLYQKRWNDEKESPFKDVKWYYTIPFAFYILKNHKNLSYAIFEFSYKNRLIQFIVGILAFVSLLIYKFY